MVAFRLTDQVRTTPLGQFVFSLEPYVVFGTGAVRVVPLRFSIGGIIGTKARLMGGQEVDAPRWE